MKRQIVRSKKEFTDWVNSFNGVMNCYTTVYDFEHFAETAKVDSSVIIDRAFLDFDAHGEPLEKAWVDFKNVYEKLFMEGIKFDAFFSGKGFHIIVYGEQVNDIRSIQAYFTGLAKNYPTLDRSGVQTNRLRRIPNTVNLSSEGPYFCIPLNDNDVSFYKLKAILKLAEKPRQKPKRVTSTLMKWPKVKPIEMVDVEIEAPKPPGELPIIPCLYNAIMVENPGHYARVYLTQWYRDILAMGERELPTEEREKIVGIIMNEFKAIASHANVWLDWDEQVTLKHVRFIVNGGYHAPSCKDKLIPQGYCPGKCWRYADG
tara:strand:- start:3693 stop:4640 length:948 start_codon:yes stop_codon:yes gene_type:complete